MNVNVIILQGGIDPIRELFSLVDVYKNSKMTGSN